MALPDSVPIPNSGVLNVLTLVLIPVSLLLLVDLSLRVAVHGSYEFEPVSIMLKFSVMLRNVEVGLKDPERLLSIAPVVSVLECVQIDLDLKLQP